MLVGCRPGAGAGACSADTEEGSQSSGLGGGEPAAPWTT